MKKKSEGMTLVELIAVMAIMVIISAIIFSLFNGSNKLFNRTREQSNLQDEVRMISSSLENDIRTGSIKNVTYPADKKTVGFPALVLTDPPIIYDVKARLHYSTDVEVIYAFTKGNEQYAYALVGTPTGIREIKKIRCDTNTEMATLSKNVKVLTVDRTNSPYTLSIELENLKGIKESMVTRVQPRNE